jgi:hypothetical protein
LRPISFFVRGFLQQAEDILDVAASGDSTLQDVVISMDRLGGMRMLDPAGWSLPALAAEYGATAVYKVERRGAAVRVEGWNGTDRCLVQRTLSSGRLCALPGMGTGGYRASGTTDSGERGAGPVTGGLGGYLCPARLPN